MGVKSKNPKKHVVSCRIDDETMQQLRVIESRGVSRSDLLEDGLKAMISIENLDG